MNLLITICARGGSKGIPGKNIKPIAGKPLIAYSIKHAIEFAHIHNADITLSTDSVEILKVASEYNLTTKYIRPENLATDNTGKIAVLRDILNYEEIERSKKYDYVLDLDITSPLRTIEDLEAAFSMLKSNIHALNLYSVSPSHRNPYFNMVEYKDDQFIEISKKMPSDILSRQKAPIVYDVNASFYFYTKSFFKSNLNTATTHKTMIFVVPHICFDLDELIDFEFMTYLIENNKLNFNI
jgi:CMP-N,N'-diacetyllegionaminic acid synthase